MAFDPNLAERQLLAMYARAPVLIMEKILQKQATGNSVEFERELLSDVLEILSDLDQQSKEWARQVLPKLYEASAREAATALQRAGVVGARAASDPFTGSFARVHRAAVRVVAENFVDEMDDAHRFVARRIRDGWRRAQLEALERRFTTGQTLREAQKNLATIIGDQGLGAFRDTAGRTWRLDSYVEMAARTSGTEATNLGLTTQLQTMNRDLVQMTTHVDTCEDCAAVQGRVYSISGRDSRYPPLSRAVGEYHTVHPNCVPSGVAVTGPKPLAHVTRWYEGELVVINTAGGDQLPITPNHPILTPQGWVAAGLLKEGDQIIHYRPFKRVVVGVGPDDIQVPTLIEDIAGALGKPSDVATVPVPVSAEDFHGDGIEGEICIVRANRLLLGESVSALRKPASEPVLQVTDVEFLPFDGESASALLLEAVFTASHSIKGVGRQFPALCLRHACQAAAHRFATIGSGRVSGFGEAFADGHFADAEVLCNRLLGRAGFVHPYNLVDGERFSVRPLLRHDLRADVSEPESGFSRPLFDEGDADAEDVGDLLHRLAGQVEFGYVIKVERRYFSGQVYNLQTTEGWFACNSIITHNCRHRLLPYVEELADDPEADRAFSNRSFDVDPRTEAEKQRYKDQQGERRQLREDRKQWESYRAWLPDDAPKTLAGFRRMKATNSERYQELQRAYREVRAAARVGE